MSPMKRPPPAPIARPSAATWRGISASCRCSHRETGVDSPREARYPQEREAIAMPSNVFRFDESWSLPGADVAEVYEVLAHGEWLPLWWKGVYLKAEKLTPTPTPEVGDRLKVRARGALPYQLDFILEAVELRPNERVAVQTYGDFNGRWSATLSQRGEGVRVDIVWEVTVLKPWLKRLAPLLRPAFAWNHRWTTPRGEKGLRDFL